MEDIITQLHIMEYVNVYLVVFLLGVGFILKHLIRNLSNNYIPFVLYSVGLIYELISLNSYDKISIINCIIDGTIAAAIAIGLHSGGKRIISFDKVLEAIINSISETDDIDDEEESTSNKEEATYDPYDEY